MAFKLLFTEEASSQLNTVTLIKRQLVAREKYAGKNAQRRNRSRARRHGEAFDCGGRSPVHFVAANNGSLSMLQCIKALEKDKGFHKRLKAVRKALAYLESNPRHPGLSTHKYSSLRGFNGEDVFEAYAENQTSAAYRIFWHYGPGTTVITIIAITPHP